MQRFNKGPHAINRFFRGFLFFGKEANLHLEVVANRKIQKLHCKVLILELDIGHLVGGTDVDVSCLSKARNFLW